MSVKVFLVVHENIANIRTLRLALQFSLKVITCVTPCSYAALGGIVKSANLTQPKNAAKILLRLVLIS